jgi:uncharacterized Zn ribbon protein
MKTIFIVTAILLSGHTLWAQKVAKKDVPSAVQKAFSKGFPDATSVKWEKENGNYEASFEKKESEISVVYDANGTLLETETEISIKELPVSVLDYVKAHYKGQKIKEAATITDANGMVTFEAEIKGMDLIFDSKGSFLKEVKD